MNGAFVRHTASAILGHVFPQAQQYNVSVAVSNQGTATSFITAAGAAKFMLRVRARTILVHYKFLVSFTWLCGDVAITFFFNLQLRCIVVHICAFFMKL